MIAQVKEHDVNIEGTILPYDPKTGKLPLPANQYTERDFLVVNGAFPIWRCAIILKEIREKTKVGVIGLVDGGFGVVVVDVADSIKGNGFEVGQVFDIQPGNTQVNSDDALNQEKIDEIAEKIRLRKAAKAPANPNKKPIPFLGYDITITKRSHSTNG